MTAYWDSEQGRMVDDSPVITPPVIASPAPAPVGAPAATAAPKSTAPYLWVRQYDAMTGGGEETNYSTVPAHWARADTLDQEALNYVAAPPNGAPAAPGPVGQMINPDLNESSLGLKGVLVKGPDGYYLNGQKTTAVTDQMVPGLQSGADTRQQQAIEHNKNDRMTEFAALAGFGGLLYAGALSTAAAGASSGGAGFAEGWSGAAGAGADPTIAATTGAAATPAVTDVVPFPGAGDAAANAAANAVTEAVPAVTAPAASKGLIGTALTGAAKGAAISAGVQLATTGKVDLVKTLAGAAAGGFASVLGSEVADITGSNLIGQIAGSIGAAGVNAALTGGAGHGASTSETGADTSADTSVAPTINKAGLVFSANSLKFTPVGRKANWSTPRMDWAGKS